VRTSLAVGREMNIAGNGFADGLGEHGVRVALP